MSNEDVSILNRLKSIYYDSNMVNEVISGIPEIEVVANLRCGKWYCSNSNVKTCYFKSTDGHKNKWDFNTRRLNINVLEYAFTKKSILIIDATANHRKIYPDALSKTIPIWIYTINTYIEKHINRTGTTIVNETIKLPRFIDNVEKNDLTDFTDKKVNDWITDLESILDEATITNIYNLVNSSGCNKMVPMFVSSLDTLNMVEYYNIIQNNDIPIICFSVGTNDSIFIENQFDRGFKYILGAGDDEEMWSHGLTADLFWKDPNRYLCCQNDNELIDVIQQSLSKQLDLNTDESINFIDGKIMCINYDNTIVNFEKYTVYIKIITSSLTVNKNVGDFNLKSKKCLERLLYETNQMIEELMSDNIEKIIIICTDFRVSIAILVSIFVQFRDTIFETDLKLSKNDTISKDYIRKIISYIYHFCGKYQLTRCFCQQLNRFYIENT